MMEVVFLEISHCDLQEAGVGELLASDPRA